MIIRPSRSPAALLGAPSTVGFDATIPGVFEVELHEARTQPLSLQVG